jgi:hypothetical protein
MEASMRGSSRKLPETAKSDLIWDIGIFALPVLMVIALIGLATTNQAASIWINWISEGAQAEFAGSYLMPDSAPTQAEPAREIQEVGADWRLCPLFIAPCSYWAASQFWPVIRVHIPTVK